MRRRQTLALLGAAALMAPRALRAQQASPVLGLLSGRSRAETGSVLAEFHRGLAEAGYSEGQNLQIEYRWAEGRYDRLPALAAELVERRVAVITAIGGSVTAIAAKAATDAIPIVFLGGGGDPVKNGLVASLGRPGGNVTGVSLFFAELGAKRLELLRELVPNLARIAVLINPNNPGAGAEAREVRARAAALGLEAQVVHAASEGDLEPAFVALSARAIGALLLANDPYFVDLRDRLVA